ncbi:EamA family transporter RarD [Celerinatantimonas sp. YJH-8]|uniref:EamA family transporter RarD n=1 Tax=Celerinatantimonas sp. YJH-8 TaxID=3228714 RepID=UPI0038C6BD98
MSHNSSVRLGAIYAFTAYLIWGIAPIYFRAIDQVAASDILCHRIIWSCVLLVLLSGFTRNGPQIQQILRRPRQLLILLITALLIGCNWLIFIWAVNHHHILDTSLGYFITPLVNVVMGILFLRERLRTLQWLAVILALAGVLVELIEFGAIPWIASALALSFSSYGLLRKQIQIAALPGLLIETVWLLPLALIYLIFWDHSGSPELFTAHPTLTLLVICAGIVTTVPLLFFTGAATRLPLSTLGFFQYLAPSLTFILAITLYQEPLAPERLLTFGFIWVALLVFIFENRRHARISAH